MSGKSEAIKFILKPILRNPKIVPKAKLIFNGLERFFTGEAAAEKQLNKLAKQRIFQQTGSWRPTQKMLEANLEGKKQAIRDAKAMRSATSKAELEWMKNNADKATKVYKSGAIEFGGDENKLALLKARQEAMKPFISQGASKIRKKRLGYTIAAVAGTPAVTGTIEGAYNTFNNWRNNSDKTTFDNVKQNKDFIDWLYKSGGEKAPLIRRINNFHNVAGNYVTGLLNPHGRTMFNLGEGTERQAVAASLYNLAKGGDGSISDSAHNALGGKHGDSGSSFHKQNSDDKGFWEKVFDQFVNAINLPYHNIYGQSAGTGFDKDGFYSRGDNYTFNNVWGKKPNGKIGVVQILGDGEGNSSLYSSIKAGIDAKKAGVEGIQPIMETVAALRGVDTKRHSDVTNISLEQLNKWAREYSKQRNNRQKNKNV